MAARRKPGDTTMDSYGTAVPADGYLGTSTTGTVSVINTANPSAAVGSIPVGLHPTAMYLNGNALFVANTNSDTVSVIDTDEEQVVQTIETRPWPASKVGYEPTGIALTSDGHLLVTLGRANAVAVYRYHGDSAAAGELHRPAADRLLPGQRGRRRRQDRRHQHAAASTRAARPSRPTRAREPYRHRPRHAQHHCVADALHPAERQGIAAQVHRRPFRTQNGWGNERRAAGAAARKAASRFRSRYASATRRPSSTSSCW